MRNKLLICFLLGLVIYMTGFIWSNNVVSLITMFIGGIIYAVSIFIFGKNIKVKNKVIGILSITYSVFSLIVLLFVSLGTIIVWVS